MHIQRSGRQLLKDILFDILSLVNQLYESKSINLNGPKYEKSTF